MPIFFFIDLPVLRLNQTIDFLLQLFDSLLLYFYACRLIS